MSYRFPTRRRVFEPVKAPGFEIEKEETLFDRREVGEIYGRMAASFEEWIMALVWWALGLRFFYQYSVMQYRVDFLVEDHPLWVPVEVQGVYWHSGRYASGQRFRGEIIERILGRKISYIYDYELTSWTDALRVGRNALL